MASRKGRRAPLTAPADDAELTLVADGWACPACEGTFAVFYGTEPHRLCLDCWVTENPFDPFTLRLDR